VLPPKGCIEPFASLIINSVLHALHHQLLLLFNSEKERVTRALIAVDQQQIAHCYIQP
jgi:hypothetical protein